MKIRDVLRNEQLVFLVSMHWGDVHVLGLSSFITLLKGENVFNLMLRLRLPVVVEVRIACIFYRRLIYISWPPRKELPIPKYCFKKACVELTVGSKIEERCLSQGF